MCKTVYVSWQEPVSRRRYVVGRLSELVDGSFEFVYTKGALMSACFIPFPGMRILERVYRSSELFPFFSNRLLGKNRPEYKQFIDWLALPYERPSPLDILARTDGLRATDAYQIFERVQADEQANFSVTFFLRDLVYEGTKVTERVLSLQPNEALRLEVDSRPSATPTSVMVVTESKDVIGCLPSFLTKDVAMLLTDDSLCCQASVVAIHPHAPRRYKCLRSCKARFLRTMRAVQSLCFDKGGFLRQRCRIRTGRRNYSFLVLNFDSYDTIKIFDR